MKKLLSIAFAAAMIVPSSAAMALQEAGKFEIYVNDDFAGVMHPYLYKDAGKACLYVSEWYNQGYLISEECDLLERKTKGYLSCLGNSYINFPTTIASDVYCRGFNDWGLSLQVEYMHVGEHYDGFAGIVKFKGYPYVSNIEAWAY
ncbi:hypothetical protein [Polyangium spumosum]|uniref:Uncharacterized protein n=1 Tax=Polyangium spumosum TaxID=889282 RepID=A0A6N7PNJ3_9BACT|nr:hypothetical protein [Polyangium spumosum]MRG91724.1 hypothetical protein [Polyangium spumosum]